MSNPGAGDYYAVLGVPRRASEAELKKAYKRAAIRWHPDKNPDDRATAEENFKKIAEAFAVLSNADQRAAYDRHGKEGARVAERRGGAPGFAGGFGPGQEVNPAEFFAHFFGDGAGARAGGGAQPGGPQFFFNGVRPAPRRRQQQPQPQPIFGEIKFSALLEVVPPPLVVMAVLFLGIVGFQVCYIVMAMVMRTVHYTVPIMFLAHENIRTRLIFFTFFLVLVGILPPLWKF